MPSTTCSTNSTNVTLTFAAPVREQQLSLLAPPGQRVRATGGITRYQAVRRVARGAAEPPLERTSLSDVEITPGRVLHSRPYGRAKAEEARAVLTVWPEGGICNGIYHC
jgi:hypothetical protein